LRELRQKKVSHDEGKCQEVCSRTADARGQLYRRSADGDSRASYEAIGRGAKQAREFLLQSFKLNSIDIEPAGECSDAGFRFQHPKEGATYASVEGGEVVAGMSRPASGEIDEDRDSVVKQNVTQLDVAVADRTSI